MPCLKGRIMKTNKTLLASLAGALLALIAPLAGAQLTDATQTGPSVPGGTIAKSLEEQIGGGYGDASEYGSSGYLILRDPARAIRRGRQIFQRKFTQTQGLGPRVNPDSTGLIAENRALGAGLADSCAACHGRPKGSAGFGGDVVTRPDSRDAPHLFGIGLVEMLADEITSRLRSIRERAIARAQRSGRPSQSPLHAKGIDYGWLLAYPDGSVDTSGVRGVDADLRVKPFFHHGATFSTREFAIGAFNDEMGMQVFDPLLCGARPQEGSNAGTSAAGMRFDPALDKLTVPPACSASADPDVDGVVNEIDPALLDYMEFYLLNYFKPGQTEVNGLAERGLELMNEIGCVDCHRQNLVIRHDRRVADVETTHDTELGIMNRLYSVVEPKFAVIEDGAKHPQLAPLGDQFVVRNIFADFRRHDLGPAFHEVQHDGSIVREFMTEPLWGVATTPPYGHDGRSINLKEVILRHGGEAQASKQAFASLRDLQQLAVLEFLNTLVLFPPDDTASNLNPGNPLGDLQTEHGSIALSELFQIKELGPE